MKLRSLLTIIALLGASLTCPAAPPAVTPSTESVVIGNSQTIVFPTGRQLLQTFTAATRASVTPVAVGQLAWETDTGILYVSNGTDAGDWTLFSLAFTSISGVPSYQPLDSDLTAIAGVATSSFGRGLLAELDASTLRTTAGLVIGTDIQAFDADLTDLADGTLTGSKVQQQMSIASDGSGLKLSGDSGSPGNYKLYGTNGSGVKGWLDAVTAPQFYGTDGATSTNAGGAGGNLDMRGGNGAVGGDGGAGGSINLHGSDADNGNAGAAGGSIDLSASSTAPGGSIVMSAGGGSLNTTGTGFIQLGTAGTRTELGGTASADRVIFLPDADTNLIGHNTTQELSNKTISGSLNTLTNISLTTAVTGTLPVVNGGTGATSLDNLLTLGTHTTGNYVATISGTANEVSVSGSGSESATVTVSLPDDITVSSATVATEAYDATGWNGDNTVPTKDAVRDKLETVSAQSAAVEIGLACSDETTAVATGTGKVTFRMPHAMTLTGVRASVTTAPTGSTIIVDINENTGGGAATVLSTKLSIDASEKTSTTAASAAVISDSTLADDAEITIDFDQVGSSVAGTGVKIWLIGTR